MRIYACFAGVLAFLMINNFSLAETKCVASAAIEATATVVPPVGIEACSDVDGFGAPSDSEHLFWIHAPHPGDLIVTVTDTSGEPVCLPAMESFSTLEQHRYRSLVCLQTDPEHLPSNRPYVFTVIYSAD